MSKDKYIFGFKWLSVYQIAGGLIGMAFTFSLLLRINDFYYLSVLLIFAGFLLYSFSVYCGIMLFRSQTNSLVMSLVCQSLQAVSISCCGFFYHYVSGFSLFLMLDSSESFHIRFSTSLSLFTFQTGADFVDRIIGFNVVALGIVTILYYEIKAIAREKKSDLIESIGN